MNIFHFMILLALLLSQLTHAEAGVNRDGSLLGATLISECVKGVLLVFSEYDVHAQAGTELKYFMKNGSLMLQIGTYRPNLKFTRKGAPLVYVRVGN